MVEFVKLDELTSPRREHLLDQAAAIFYGPGGGGAFGTAAEKDAFFNRWFGNYFRLEPRAFFLALASDEDAIGYLAGCTDSFAAASGTVINDIDYFTPAFRAAMQNYRSHFHINMAPNFQGKGIGRQLVSRFIQLSCATGSPGVHVVTGAASRAVNFYEACGFTRLQPFPEAAESLAVLVRANSIVLPPGLALPA